MPGAGDIEDLEHLVADLQELTHSVHSDTQTLNHISRVAKQASDVLKSTMMSTLQQHDNEVYVEIVENKKWFGHAKPQLRITSLRRGEGAGVVIDRNCSGPNALALCGNPHVKRGKSKHRTDKHGRHAATPTAGKCTGTSFTPYDFSGDKSESLVFVVDGKDDAPHTLTISTNIQNVSQVAQLLYQQPWVRRPESEEDCATAEEAAMALANHLRYYDPVGDGGLEDYVVRQCCGLFHKNTLPVPLQTDADIRRERRFDAAVSALRDEIKFRFTAVDADDDLAAATTVANRQAQQQIMLGTALSASLELQAEADEAIDATAEAIFDQVIGGG